MYHSFFGLQQRPFNHGPAEQFQCPNDSVQSAIARIQQVLTARGAIALVTGGPGVGKSALVAQALAGAGTHIKTVHLDLRQAETEDLLASLLVALEPGMDAPSPIKVAGLLRERLEETARDGRCLVVTLDVNALTMELAKGLLRLVNLAGDAGGSLNLVLQGPHTLNQQLDLPALIQLRQRIACRHRIRPLTLEETDQYIRQQILNAGGDPEAIMGSTTPIAVYCFVAGVPRLINTLMDAALCEAQLQGVKRPDGNLIKLTADGLGWKPLTPAQTDQSAASVRHASRVVRPLPVPAPRGALPVAASAPLAATDAAIKLEIAPTETRHDNPVPIDPEDPGATGILNLQELEARFNANALTDESQQSDARIGS